MRRRFKSEQQILSAIDRAHERLAKYGLMYTANKPESVFRKMAERNIERIENQVLPRLGRKLSEFRTQTFEFAGDRSIPV